MSTHKPDWAAINALKHLSERSTIKLTTEEKDLLAIVAQRAELLAVVKRESEMPCRCAGPHSECISCQARVAYARATQP